MVIRKMKFTTPEGNTLDGTDVPITTSSEPWCELTLEDGTVMRVKPVVGSVMRVDNQYDAEGNPVYMLKASHAVSLVYVPEQLRKKTQ